jgi:Ca2+-binding EF-hand superfamily protein
MFQRLDANHDGTVTRDEAQQMAAQSGGRGGRMLDRVFGNAQSLTLQQFETQSLARFDAEDLNHDGTVTAAERQQLRAQRQSERGQNPGQ